MDSEHLCRLGYEYRAQGDFAAAEQAFREALKLRPDYADAWISLGIVLRRLDRPDEAEHCQREALRFNPANFVALINLANALLDQERLEEAAETYRQTLLQNAGLAEAHNNLGKVLLRLGNESEAVQHLLRATQINPEYFEPHKALGDCWYRNGLYEDATQVLTKACKLKPGDGDARYLLAGACLAGGKPELACQHYELMLRQEPDSARAKGGLATALMRRGQYSKPKALFKEALTRLPEDDWINLNYANLLLRAHEFKEGWKHYEYRLTLDPSSQRDLPQPRWNGEPLGGRTLLLTCEQGLGDEIMFASIMPEMMREAEHCIIECDQRLHALYRRSFPDATIFPINRKAPQGHRTLEQNLDRLPAFDYWTPMGSLSRHTRGAETDFPRHEGYLIADPERTASWKTRLKDLGEGLKIGISWRGGIASTNARGRTLALNQLAPILKTPNAHFISLQYGDCADEIRSFGDASGIRVHHWQEVIDDYDDTAALISALDVVISVCTAIIHLGGALGRPVWVMAPFLAEWRYGREGPSMIWYPSVRVFRQPKPGAWPPVIADVNRALKKL